MKPRDAPKTNDLRAVRCPVCGLLLLKVHFQRGEIILVPFCRQCRREQVIPIRAESQ